MTDNEIIKALEGKLPLGIHAIHEAIDLINRQKAEIERLNKQLEELKFLESRVNSIKNTPKDTFSGILISLAEGVARYESIKEFAERLKEKAWHGIWETINHVDVDEIDNLVKEMVGEG